MSLLLYGVVDAEKADEARISGMDGRPLRAIRFGNLAAVVGEQDSPVSADLDSLVVYERAVEVLMSRGAVVPARFATTAPGEDDIERMLRERHDELTATLSRVRSAVEFGVRAEQAPDDHELESAEPATGTDYMLGKLSLSRRARELAEHLDAELAPLARARTCRLLPRQGTLLACAYLVERERADDFLSAARGLSAARAELVISGPWPPYSFVTEAES